MAPNTPYPMKIRTEPIMNEHMLKRKKLNAEYEAFFRAIRIASMLRAIDCGTRESKAIVVRVNLKSEGSVR